MRADTRGAVTATGSVWHALRLEAQGQREELQQLRGERLHRTVIAASHRLQRARLSSLTRRPVRVGHGYGPYFSQACWSRFEQGCGKRRGGIPAAGFDGPAAQERHISGRDCMRKRAMQRRAGVRSGEVPGSWES
jgi:hypothetical protein